MTLGTLAENHRESRRSLVAHGVSARGSAYPVAPGRAAKGRFSERTPEISPDGRWLAYSSSETGRSEIVVVSFPNAGEARWPVSVGGGAEPLWSRDGRELFYRNGRRELVSIRVETHGTFSIGATSVVFPDRDYLSLGFRRQYDVTPDGQRFLMIRPVGSGRERRLILVRNAFSGLVPGAAR